jgi:hypothetical protein
LCHGREVRTTTHLWALRRLACTSTSSPSVVRSITASSGAILTSSSCCEMAKPDVWIRRIERYRGDQFLANR